jgi:RNA polymerase sigma factor (sigma-70 family)
VQKAQEGDVQAMSQLYQQFSKAMFNICLRMTANATNAEDLLQESFIKAFKNLHQLKNENQFAGWLKRIVINECIRFSKKNIQWNEWNDIQYDFSEDETEWWKDISLQTINNAIKTLPDGCRQIFNLFVLEDFSHSDIAQQLNISESTSKSQYHRARKLLKEKITEYLKLHGQI